MHGRCLDKGHARLLSTEDVSVVISHTGSTRETIQTARAAREAGATVLAITSFARSALTDVVDHALVAGTRELGLQLDAMASRLAHLAILDALLVTVAERDPRRAKRALALYACPGSSTSSACRPGPRWRAKSAEPAATRTSTRRDGRR